MKIFIVKKISPKDIIIICAIFVALIIGIFATGNLKHSQAFSMSDGRNLPIYCVDTKDKKVAISFNTNWGSNNTNKILNILDSYDVKATFFLIGNWIDKYPEQTKQIYSKGHELGNHSNSHPDFTKISENKIIQEVAITDAKLVKLTGVNTNLFRFPSGSYDNKSVSSVEKTNHKCIQWDVDSIDWKENGADIEYDRVIKKVKPGSIILFHTSAKYTPEVLPRVIKDLRAKGYKFVKISDLIYKENYYINHAGKQIVR